ncbi:hypothetical protein [Paraburkholderia hospita]|uniref:Uncharacterized protein n=1 Tax=Paraburkholderia hospita TaxID=169430 RepID=A0ABN0FRF2_9BURK|nr:hypothetical protein [Paraburkholderia hospita]EIN01347.1 hypothetical protein WQE_09464 [Paraburkholderia hospita]OUL85514.1 hypothetical protein CA602_17945 [Paraburkholderia hospita]SEI15386.1 hypothetical protein SAMN05192544_102652 [Paraburkholderia hospita]
MSARVTNMAQTGRKIFATIRPRAQMPPAADTSGQEVAANTEKGLDGWLESKAILGFQTPRPSASSTGFELFNQIIAQRAGAKK